MERLLEAHGVRPGPVLTSPEVFWHYQEAVSGRALGCTVEHLANAVMFRQSPDVVAVPFEGMEWVVGLSYVRGRALAEHEQAFLDFAVPFFK